MKTLAALLYPDAANGRAQLEERLRGHPLMEPMLIWPGILATIAQDILTYLEMPAGNLAVTAYQKHRLIEEAKRETANSLGSRQVVQLMQHKIKKKVEPKVEVEVNGIRKTLLNLELSAELTIESVTAIVEFGQVVDITPGSATGSLKLSAAGVELARAETQPIDLSVPDETKVVIDLTALGEPIVHPVPAAG